METKFSRSLSRAQRLFNNSENITNQSKNDDFIPLGPEIIGKNNHCMCSNSFSNHSDCKIENEIKTKNGEISEIFAKRAICLFATLGLIGLFPSCIAVQNRVFPFLETLSQILKGQSHKILGNTIFLSFAYLQNRLF